MTNSPPPYPGQPHPYGPVPPPKPPGWFRRLSPGGRTGVILGGVLSVFLLCCSGLAVVGSFGDAPQQQSGRRAVADENVPTAAAPIVVPSTPAETTPAPPAPTTASPTPSPTPVVTTRTETSTQKIGYAERTVKDSSLAEGKRVVRTRGVAGVRTLTYEVTLTDGVPTGRRLVKSVVTRQPVTQVVAVGTRRPSSSGSSGCDPNYSPCVPIASDVDCAGGSGNGPAYVSGPVRVIGRDIYDLDRDGDGIACD
ncbi:G5 domain-containing protein [Micromonospora mangrovi]|uniref:G5 domain-containing protein n=2 Tax=Micromonospora TaxID=1873 RepID=A0AAU7M2K3_9ACTN